MSQIIAHYPPLLIQVSTKYEKRIPTSFFTITRRGNVGEAVTTPRGNEAQLIAHTDFLPASGRCQSGARLIAPG
jgi:hypothetical protein